MDLQDAACLLLLEELGGRTDVAEALLGAAEEGGGCFADERAGCWNFLLPTCRRPGLFQPLCH